MIDLVFFLSQDMRICLVFNTGSQYFGNYKLLIQFTFLMYLRKVQSLTGRSFSFCFVSPCRMCLRGDSTSGVLFQAEVSRGQCH